MITAFAVILFALLFKLICLTAIIWFVVIGFRVHWGWGVANLLIPGAFIPFAFFHEKESKIPMILVIVALSMLLILRIWSRYFLTH